MAVLFNPPTREIPGAHLLNVLIIDDERSVRDGCKEACRLTGFNTFTAVSADLAY